MLLKEVADRLADPRQGKAEAVHDNFSDAARSIMSEIQRRRLSKSAVMNMIGQVSREKARHTFPKGLPLRHLVEEFVSQASQAEVENLLSLLGRGGPGDAYLQGILKRS